MVEWQMNGCHCQLVGDELTDGWMEGMRWMDGWMMDGRWRWRWMQTNRNERIDGWMNCVSRRICVNNVLMIRTRKKSRLYTI